MMEVSSAVDQLLRERLTATLGTIRGDGSPQASVVWYHWDDGELAISTIHSTAKWHNLLRDPRCSLCVEDPVTGRMVVAYGTVRLQSDGVYERTRDLVDHYYDDPADTEAHMARIFRTDDRVLIHLRPSRIVTRRLE